MTETNRPAPSFACTAIELLQSNNVIEAAKLCASGVQHYPDYIGGYILLADAYESLGQLHDAQLIRDELHTRFPALPALKSYVQYIKHVEHPSDVVEVVEVESANVVEFVPEPVAVADIESKQINVTDVEPEPVAVTDIESEPMNVTDIEPEPVAVADVEPELGVVAQVEPEPTHQSHPNVLRIIEMVPVTNDTRIIKSSSVRLIPGLEYTSLRFEGTRSRGRRQIATLMEPPAFRTFHQMRRAARPAEGTEPRKKPVTLEELAARLHDARMPRTTVVDQEPSTVDFSAPTAPIMATETIARIYMQQGSFDLAIEAFKTLQKQKPGKHDEFELLIKECERKRS